MKEIKRLTNKMIEEIKTNNNIDDCLQVAKYAANKAWDLVNITGINLGYENDRLDRYKNAWEIACKRVVDLMFLQGLEIDNFKAIAENNNDFYIVYYIGENFYGDEEIKPASWGDMLA